MLRIYIHHFITLLFRNIKCHTSKRVRGVESMWFHLRRILTTITIDKQNRFFPIKKENNFEPARGERATPCWAIVHTVYEIEWFKSIRADRPKCAARTQCILILKAFTKNVACVCININLNTESSKNETPRPAKWAERNKKNIYNYRTKWSKWSVYRLGSFGEF